MSLSPQTGFALIRNIYTPDFEALRYSLTYFNLAAQVLKIFP